MKKKNDYKKGQMNLQNYAVIFLVFICAIIFMPVINTISDYTVAQLLISPNSGTAILITAIRFIPTTIILAIIATCIYFAIPRRQEGIQY